MNYALGFHQLTNYSLFGPPGTMSLSRSLDLIDLTLNLGDGKRLPKEMQNLVGEQLRTYLLQHFVASNMRMSFLSPPFG